MHLSSYQHVLLAQPAQGGNIGILIILAVMLLVMLLIFVIFARVFGLWLQAFLSRANISVLQIVAMTMRKTDAKQIVRLKIMSVQSGIDVPTHELERAYLSGVNVERAVLAMIRAKETGEDVTWEQLVSADVDERLRENA